MQTNLVKDGVAIGVKSMRQERDEVENWLEMGMYYSVKVSSTINHVENKNDPFSN
jgi:hypothetical protein